MMANSAPSHPLPSSLDSITRTNGPSPPSHTSRPSPITSRKVQKVVMSHPSTFTKEEFYNELLQRCIAWMMLVKGFQDTEARCLELSAAWLALWIEKVGAQACAYAQIRGCDQVNYIDLKKSIQNILPNIYEMIYETDQLPNTTFGHPPKEMPKIQPLPPLMTYQPNWLAMEWSALNPSSTLSMPASFSNSATIMSGVPTSASTTTDHSGPNLTRDPTLMHAVKRPPWIPAHLPQFPLEFLYKFTPLEEEKAKILEEQKLSRKYQLQLQLPHLQAPAIPEVDSLDIHGTETDSLNHLSVLNSQRNSENETLWGGST